MALARILLLMACVLPLAACGAAARLKSTLAREAPVEEVPAQREWLTYDVAPPKPPVPDEAAAPPSPAAQPKARQEGEWGSYAIHRPRGGSWSGATAWRHPPTGSGETARAASSRPARSW